MTTLTIQKAKEDLQNLVMKSLADNEIMTISTDEGAVVVIPESEWNSIKETIRLLKDKRALKALLDGHEARRRGSSIESVTPELVLQELNKCSISHIMMIMDGN